MIATLGMTAPASFSATGKSSPFRHLPKIVLSRWEGLIKLLPHKWIS